MIFRSYILFIGFMCAALISFGQRGPGGVSDDSNDQKNCRLWLDTKDLTWLSDGDSVVVWYDKSISAPDSAFRDPLMAHKYNPPVFRNTPSAGINGHPVISFENGGMLGIGRWPLGEASPDLNSNPGMITTYEQTTFLAFRTSNNVSDRQILWEEGGAERGMTIYIYQDSVYIGAFDVKKGDPDFSLDGIAVPGRKESVPAFGFTYKTLPVQVNTTYILCYKYDVRKDNHLITNDPATLISKTGQIHTGLTGTLNGQAFPTEMKRGKNYINSSGTGHRCSECPTAVGGIYVHPDPVGIGGMNQGGFNEYLSIYGGNGTTPEANWTNRNKPTGDHQFTGRIAEIVYYAHALNPAEQIIVENYLAAKYFANIIANDKFDFKPEFGNGVIGIGREADATKQHNRSQGDNLFEIKPKTSWTGAHQFVLVGHNINAATSWTATNTPDTTSIQRLRRTWRWDVKGISGNNKEIEIKLYPQDIAKLPPLPDGYTKYGIMLGDHTSNAPNFTGSNTQVIEFTQHHFGDSTEFFISLNIQKGSYFTICAIKPQVQFRTATDFAIEGDVGQDAKTAEIYLNHKPAPTTTYDIYFSVLDGTAQRTLDYEWDESDSPRTISFPNTSSYIPFKIINDVTTLNDLPVEYFTITLTGTTNGLTIGPRSTLTYSIYDNDPPPKVSFEMAEYTFAESEGEVNIAVKVIGQELTAPATATVEYVPNSGTATINEDFTLASPQILNFDALNSTAYFTINIIDDTIDEDDEYFEIKITNTTGDLGFSDTLIVVAKIYITDNDLPPKVSFITPASEGYRSVSNPLIPVQLSNISAKEILVPFHLLGGTAVNDAIASGGDYAASPAGGTLVFQPGDSLKYLYVDNDNVNHLIVYNNYTFSPGDEKTIIFELDENPVNAEREEFIQHIYTIKDYLEFEWQGLAGVGKKPSNTFIMAPDAAIDGSSIPNLGPTSVTISQPTNSKRPTITTRENGLNNKKLIQFDGTKQHLIPESPTSNKNTSGLSGYIQFGNNFDNKSLFFVIIPEKVNATEPQIIFEAGAQRTGMSIYIIQNKLYFQAWGYQTDLLSNPASEGLWGLDPTDQTGVAYVVYEGLVANTPYVISCHYENNFSQTPSIGGLSMFVNGIKVATYNGDVRRMLSNGGSASIGSVLFQTRFYYTKYLTDTNTGHTIPSKDKNATSHFFKGKMGDFYYFNEPIINEARVRIIHNYLSAKYNIPLQPSAQVFNLDYANNTPGSAVSAFNFETAGVGKIGDAVHGDSQGESEMRVRGVQFKNGLNEAFMMWGNNGESLTNTWPVSSSHLPSGIKERSAKVWRFSSLPANGVETIEILLKFGNTQNATAFSQNPDFLKLLVSQDPNDFTNAVAYPAQILSGNIAKFSNVVVNNGMYVALGNTSPIYPLPIELLNFNAQLNKPVVDIDWSTASEYNNDYFVVERAGEDLIWQKIATVPGAGISNSIRHYSEKDKNPLKGISYYRLKQVDYDGGYKYSDVVSVINGLTTGGDKMVVYPNPSEQQQIFVKLPAQAVALSGNITICDITGKNIYTSSVPVHQEVIPLNISHFNPGIYLLTYTNEIFMATQKLVISH